MKAMAIEVVSGVHGKFVTFTNDLITSQIRRFGAHTRNEIAFLAAFVKPGDAVVDVGAHIGTFSIPLAKAVGQSGRILAVEANPATFSLLQANVDINGLSHRIQCLNAAVGTDGCQCGLMTVAPGNSGAAFFAPGGEGRRFRGLKRILSEAGFDGVDVLKIDVEGMEGVILHDSIQVLEAHRPILYFEVSRNLMRYGTSPVGLWRLLVDLQYRMFRNIGPRNSNNDSYKVQEIVAPPSLDVLFDCLAIPSESAAC